MNSTLEIYNNAIRKVDKLTDIYRHFWLNIYYNDTYIFYKFAIEFYKDILENNPRGFFLFINEKLYDGSCPPRNKSEMFAFKHHPEIKNIKPDDLCALSKQIIDILDTMFFTVCPSLPFSVEVFRKETRDSPEKISEILSLKKGDYYRPANYLSTSVNPFFWSNNTIHQIFSNYSNLDINFHIILPKDSKCFYNPYTYSSNTYSHSQIKNKKYKEGFCEWEITLPRGNIFEIIDTKLIGNILFIKMILKYQIIPSKHPMKTEPQKPPKIIINTPKLKKFAKSKYVPIDGETVRINKKHTLLEIYKETLHHIDMKLYTDIEKATNNFEKSKTELDITKYPLLIEKHKEFSTNSQIISDLNLFSDPGYLIKMCNNIPLSWKYEDIVNYFTETIKIKKERDFSIRNNSICLKLQKTRNIFINGKDLRLRKLNFLDSVIKIVNIKPGSIIKVTNGLFFYNKFDSSILNDSNDFITSTDKKYSKNPEFPIDKKFPYLIIIKYKSEVDYFPVNFNMGYTAFIEKMTVDAVTTVNITDEIYYYIIEAS
jgi:hypothetical protein